MKHWQTELTVQDTTPITPVQAVVSTGQKCFGTIVNEAFAAGSPLAYRYVDYEDLLGGQCCSTFSAAR